MKTILGLFALVCIAEAVYFEKYDPRPMDLAQLLALENDPIAKANEKVVKTEDKAVDKLENTVNKANDKLDNTFFKAVDKIDKTNAKAAGKAWKAATKPTDNSDPDWAMRRIRWET